MTNSLSAGGWFKIFVDELFIFLLLQCTYSIYLHDSESFITPVKDCIMFQGDNIDYTYTSIITFKSVSFIFHAHPF